VQNNLKQNACVLGSEISMSITNFFGRTYITFFLLYSDARRICPLIITHFRDVYLCDISSLNTLNTNVRHDLKFGIVVVFVIFRMHDDT
jgi:hypothetical protein